MPPRQANPLVVCKILLAALLVPVTLVSAPALRAAESSEIQLRLCAPAWRNIGRQTPQEVARRFTVIFGHLPPQPFHAGNPATRCFKYILGPYVDRAHLHTLPREALAADKDGGFVKAREWENWLVVPDNPRWLDHVRRTVAELMRSDFDGIFVDSMGTAPVASDYTVTRAINPHTGRPYTKAEWLAAERVMLQAIAAAMPPGKQITLNGLGEGARYWTEPIDDSPRVLLPLAHGAMSEIVWRHPRAPLTAWPSVEHWNAEVAMIRDVESRGLMGFWWTKCWTDGNTSDREPDAARLVPQWRRFALASYLYAAGAHSYFNFDTVKNDRPASNAAEFFPEYEVPLGSALAPGAPLGETGLHARRFTGGLVLVNPTAADVPALDAPWPDCAGIDFAVAGESRTVRFPLRMPAHTGLILARKK